MKSKNAVDNNNDFVVVSLWNNTIASIDYTTKELLIDHCGYITTTTASRLNAIVQALTGGKINRKQGVMYYNGKPFHSALTIKF